MQNYGGRKELSRDERDALKQRTANLHTQSVADLRTTWRVALKKEAEDRAAEIQELCKLHDLSALNTQLSELVAAEAALPPLHTIRPECYACALPIVGTDSLLQNVSLIAYRTQVLLCAELMVESSTSAALSATNATLISLPSHLHASPCTINITACLAARRLSQGRLQRSVQPQSRTYLRKPLHRRNQLKLRQQLRQVRAHQHHKEMRAIRPSRVC